jgi:subtilase family serine protease
MRGTGKGALRLAISLALLALLIAVAAVAVFSHASRTVASHTMAPAITAGPKYQRVSDAQITKDGQVYYGCQLSSPPVGPCYGPDQIRAAYGIQPLLSAGKDGSGRTIAIIDAYGSSTLAADLAYFDTKWGLPAANLTTVYPSGPPDATDPGNAQGWSGETTLDVEWSHAVAPGAKILLIIAKSNNDADILAATQWLANNNNADVLSQSYGEAESCMGNHLLLQQHAIFDKLTSEGITIFASAGDDGAAQPSCDGNSLMKVASTPASDPDVTGVGGTTLVANGVTGAYGSESVWNETDLLGELTEGGSGISSTYGKPGYQSVVLKQAKNRVVPDVSYNAAVLAGVLTRWGGLTYRFGGTSAGSPQWAALTAIADQIAGHRLGGINKTLYSLGSQSPSTYFHDVTTGDNSLEYFGPGTGTPIVGYSAAPGFDAATGWGTPIASALVPKLANP